MKTLHRHDLYGWSSFDEVRNIDFHGTVWVRDEGNIVIDPVSMTDHDRDHLEGLGGAAWVVITNSDHLREAQAVAHRTGAQIAAPAAERFTWPAGCQRWLKDGDELVPGFRSIELHGSKTPGELALLIEETTLVTGDLIRVHQGGVLTLLPDPKLTDKAAAIASLERLCELRSIQSVIVGDGWPIFRDGHRRLQELLARYS